MGTDEARSVCEIYSVAHKHTVRWKWRYTAAGGATVDCAEEYAVFFDCVHAARARGYEPRAKWTGCALVLAEK